jgi:hypothetical protein
MRLSLKYDASAYVRLLWSVNVLCLVLAATPALAQTEVFGPERDTARAALIHPVVFDPLLAIPLTPGPQAMVDIHGSDVAGTAHIAVMNGDDSYGILASAPVSTADSLTSVDARGLRRHASLGFHLTNLIWHPRRKDGELSAPWALFIHADYRFNRAEYEFADAKTLQRQTDTRLNDTASLLFGAQLFSSSRRAGYFVGFSYTYSAVFDQFGGVASNGLPLEGPTKVRGNLLRVELRHPFAGRYGFNPSVTYEKNSGVTTIDATGYAHLRREYVGARLGNESARGGRGGFFATVFVGWQARGR